MLVGMLLRIERRLTILTTCLHTKFKIKEDQITGRKTNAVRSRVSVHARAPLTCRFTNTSCLNHLATVHTIDYNAFSSPTPLVFTDCSVSVHLPTPHRVASINVQAILKYHRVFRWCGAVFIQSVISKAYESKSFTVFFGLFSFLSSSLPPVLPFFYRAKNHLAVP